MTTKLTDVIHFYLGCEVLTNQGKGSLIGVFTSDQDPSERISLEDGDCDCIEWYKPILRQLDSITEEDRTILFENVFGKFYNYLYQHYRVGNVFTAEKVDHIDGFTKGHVTLSLSSFSPKNFQYLLSKGFDLFGLIESGQAIDKNKMT